MQALAELKANNTFNEQYAAINGSNDFQMDEVISNFIRKLL